MGWKPSDTARVHIRVSWSAVLELALGSIGFSVHGLRYRLSLRHLELLHTPFAFQITRGEFLLAGLSPYRIWPSHGRMHRGDGLIKLNASTVWKSQTYNNAMIGLSRAHECDCGGLLRGHATSLPMSPSFITHIKAAGIKKGTSFQTRLDLSLYIISLSDFCQDTLCHIWAVIPPLDLHGPDLCLQTLVFRYKRGAVVCYISAELRQLITKHA